MIQKTFSLGIEDIVKPLATKIKKFNVKPGELFEKYDTDKNNRLSAEELRDALARNKLTISNEDVQVLKEYFQNKYRSNAISKNDFIDMMETDFNKLKRKIDHTEARKSLVDVRARLDAMHVIPRKLLMDYNTSSAELINISSFKIAIHSLKCLNQYDIDNLTKHLDTNNEGYISIGTFEAQVGTASMGASFRSTGKMSKSTNKWSK